MERRTVDGVTFLVPPGMEARGFLVAYSERTGGFSESPFDSLNIGYATGDQPQRVRENRDRLMRALGMPPFATAHQEHGAAMTRVGEERAGAGFEGPPSPLGRADVLTVSQPGLPVAVLVADCVPLALASPEEGLLLTVHAGWRGLAAGVVQKAVRAFDRPEGVLAAIGPAIGPCHYEVGDDVAEAVQHGSDGDAVADRRDGGLFLDLPGTVARVLRATGVSRIETADECTACETERFFSHRRDGQTGRQAMLAVGL
jgi:polyphenol oxidase